MREPEKEDLFFVEWGYETYKKNIETLSTLLKLFITLNASLLALLIGFFDKLEVCEIIKVLCLILLFMSLLLSIVGVIPRSQKIDLRNPIAIKKFKETVFRTKRIYLWVTVILLLLSLGIFGVTAIVAMLG